MLESFIPESKENKLASVIFIFSITTLFISTQFNWAINHNDFRDIWLRIIIAAAFGVITGFFYQKCLFKYIIKNKEYSKIFVKMHLPIFVIYIYPIKFLINTNIKLDSLIILVIAYYFFIAWLFMRNYKINNEIAIYKHGFPKRVSYNILLIIIFVAAAISFYNILNYLIFNID